MALGLAGPMGQLVGPRWTFVGAGLLMAAVVPLVLSAGRHLGAANAPATLAG